MSRCRELQSFDLRGCVCEGDFNSILQIQMRTSNEHTGTYILYVSQWENEGNTCIWRTSCAVKLVYRLIKIVSTPVHVHVHVYICKPACSNVMKCIKLNHYIYMYISQLLKYIFNIPLQGKPRKTMPIIANYVYMYDMQCDFKARFSVSVYMYGSLWSIF